MGPMTIRKKQVVAYTVVVAVCYGLFWVLGGAAMFYSMLVQFFVLPLSHFFLALWMGLEKSWKERQWWLLLYFGFGYFLMQYGTFSLLNMVSVGKFNPPEPSLFLLGAACALPGMALGAVIRWGRELPAAPQDRRPLWAFGLVWGGCVTLQLGLLWLPMVLQFPGTLLALFGLPYFPSEAAMAVFAALSDIAYFAGSCGLAQLAGLAAGFLVGRSPRWTGREKARLLPLFGAAGPWPWGWAAPRAVWRAIWAWIWRHPCSCCPWGTWPGRSCPGQGWGPAYFWPAGKTLLTNPGHSAIINHQTNAYLLIKRGGGTGPVMPGNLRNS